LYWNIGIEREGSVIDEEGRSELHEVVGHGRLD